MGKGAKNHTTTQTTQVPGYIEDAQKTLMDNAGRLIEPFLTVPDERIAGLTQDHGLAFDHLRGAVGDMFHSDKDLSSQIAQTAYRPDLYGYDRASEMAQRQTGASQITGDSINQMMNPYTDAVVDRAMSGMRDRFDEARTGLQSDMAARQAFGDSGRGVLEAEMANNYVTGAADMEANLRSQAYDRASGLAAQNAQLEDAGKQRGLNAAGLTMQGVTGANAARLGQAQQQLQSLSQGHQAIGDIFERQLAAGQTMAGMGDVIQGQQQKIYDDPYNLLSQMSSIVPGVTGGRTTSTQPVYSNPVGSALGALTFGKALWG